MTGLDAAFLALESPTTHLHIVGVLVLDPSDEPFELTFRRVRALVAERIELVRPFRMRLVAAPLGLGHPGLVEDEFPDLDYHVRRAGLPRPGGRQELEGLVAHLASRPLDRRRPLWEMHVVDGLADGGVAVVVKVHHAIIDGVAGAELLATFFDLEPLTATTPVTRLDRRRHEVAPGAWSRGAPGAWPGLEADQWLELFGSVPGHVDAALRSVGRTVQRARSMATQWRRETSPSTPLPLGAPKTSINRAISPHRRVAFGDLAMGDVRRVRDVLGGTVNDVVLAVTAGSLRRFFAGRGEEPEGPLVVMAPVSVRSPDGRTSLGNQLSALLVSLPTMTDDPADRLQQVRESVAAARDLDRGGGSSLVSGWAEALVPALASGVSRLASEGRLFDRLPPIFNVVVSNVPGPDIPLFLAGTRLRTMYPMGPVIEGAGVNITVISYLDRIHVGVQACWDLVPDVEVIARGMEDSLTELVRAADRRDRPVPWWHAEVPA